MQYNEKTPSYNERRYGKPWMAIVTTSLSRDFEFVDWDGRPGMAGEFSFSAEPGTLIAYGQKDIRKGRGGVDGYQICLPDGTMPTCHGLAAELRKLPLEARWRRYAESRLAYAAGPRPNESAWEWEKNRNQLAARYSAMLGVPDPLMTEHAAALGLVDSPPAPNTVSVGMDAFGL